MAISQTSNEAWRSTGHNRVTRAILRSRRSDNLIQRDEDLTKYEKIALMDLLGGYAGVHADHEVHGSGSRLYQEFFRLIFRESSEDGNGAPLQWRKRTFYDTSLKVGVLDKDHPEPNTTRRRINRPEDDDLPVLAPLVTETSSIPPKSKHRKAAGSGKIRAESSSAPTTSDLTLVWTDQARNRVIEHYDRREKIRISA
ncbi:hypothetical protein CEP54_006018 [Fusarium duplospermum]|uniref:Uncharacterized protein n=1 Tax=Fusarium duplospermum TaxID=1325734 RepID=A0A428Q9H4_9HYPO|nr:hypothetical protein CEP54_006018 [Fusarium duplospermum]